MGFEPTTATLEGWSSSAELLPLEAPRDLSRSGIIIAGRRGGVYRVSYTASPPLNWFDRLTMSGGDNTHCHSERRIQSVGPLSAQVYANRANRFYVQDTSLVCQNVHTAFEDRLGFFVASLLRMTEAARPVILNAVKNPSVGPLSVLHVSLVCQNVHTAFEDRLGFFVASLLRMTEAARPCHSERVKNPKRRSAFRSTK